MPKYCTKCRKELIEDIWTHGFDARTGETRFTRVLRCPERPVESFGYSQHDMYLWARMWFRYTWVSADAD